MWVNIVICLSNLIFSSENFNRKKTTEIIIKNEIQFFIRTRGSVLLKI